MDHDTVTERVAALRQLMAEEGVDATMVPSGDPHRSEYVPECWQRRTWISGFTGSAGTAVITSDRAGLWTDSRYWLQAASELEGGPFTLFRQGQPGVPPPADWLASHLEKDQVLGLDPQLASVAEARILEFAAKKAEGRVSWLDHSLIDRVWSDQPALPDGAAEIHALEFNGASVADKLGRIREQLKETPTDALAVTTLDAVAWLFNIRGRDVKFNPALVAYGLVEANRATLFVDADKVTPELAEHSGKDFHIAAYSSLGDALDQLGKDKARVWVEPDTASYWLTQRLRSKGARLHEAMSPITPFKAMKNDTELKGMRKSHVRDGVALVRFLHWLDQAQARDERVSEVSAAQRLEQFRAKGEHWRGPSFETISAYGPQGAIVHYRPDPEADVALTPGPEALYLLDSGGQYLDGTTDVTRTISLGEPSAEQRDCFTRVLSGHIRLARTPFPHGTSGRNLDVLARHALWEVGLDYGHGTGHGVGCYLNVHEGPQGISQKARSIALEPGMVISNEPGYYRAGAWGIRIESLVVVVDKPDVGQEGRRFLGFETITHCPIDQRLIEPGLLSADDVAWLDAYHARVREILEPHLDDPEVRAWLAEACRPLA